jgi:hypothetical protein
MSGNRQRLRDNFWISSVSSVLQIEKTHRAAGFPAIDHAVVERHYLQLLSFLDRNGMTTRKLVSGETTSIELKNHDLTDRGFEFVRRYHDRWIERIYKLRTPEAEERFLVKWLATTRPP